jgi:hypothetical protein
MANWRQIQARIRKAKNSPEAPTKLADLYNKTRDAMVAFELAALEEKSANSAEAVRWYTTAAERFRRADWKSRAEDALTRLGAPVPVGRSKGESMEEVRSEDGNDVITHATGAVSEGVFEHEDPRDRQPIIVEPEAPSDEELDQAINGNRVGHRAANRVGHIAGKVVPRGAGVGATPSLPHEKRPHRGRRGRRGGRGRKRDAGGPGLPAQTFTPSTQRPVRDSKEFRGSREVRDHGRPDRPSYTVTRTQSVSPVEPERVPSAIVAAPPAQATPAAPAEIETRVTRETPSEAAVSLPSERATQSHGAGHAPGHGRGREPAIASRLAHLESLLRRLLGSQLHSLESADEAPAGPGVLLLSDSELVDSYYVESCQTIRVALGQLSRGGGRGPRRDQGGDTFKERLAEHLGINENKVSDYLKKHCVVRWIQLDDEAHHLAHFAIGVLRTPLNAG